MIMEENRPDKRMVEVVNRLHRQTRLLSWSVVLLIVAAVFFLVGLPLMEAPVASPQSNPATVSMDFNEEDYVIIDGIEQESGFIVDDYWEIAAINCTSCHSGKLVTQNRASREGWESMIRWMQETQGLWDLGENEGPILDYLAKHYGVSNNGRRRNLEIEEWYEIK